ncbi:CVNH domain-containing protein [Nostoc sp. UIC 10607]|uniref:mannose-binding lectin n=1 Tax=Nostoc sp. UIC 10607 TaxID=3045935 RepID=UPI0039A02F56
MSRKLLGVVAFLTTSILVAITSSGNAKTSNYQQTCNEIAISGNVLSADCARLDGKFNKTSIVLLGIENIDGTLKQTDPTKISNYQFSCNYIHIEGNELKATCKKRDGTPNPTSITLNGIENINGVLKYTSSP